MVSLSHERDLLRDKGRSNNCTSIAKGVDRRLSARWLIAAYIEKVKNPVCLTVPTKCWRVSGRLRAPTSAISTSTSHPRHLAVGSTLLRVLVEECLYKPPEARPSPTRILKRLAKIGDGDPTATGLETLAEANRAAVHRRAETHEQQSVEQGAHERLTELHKTAVQAFHVVPDEFIEAIQNFAPGADLLVAPGTELAGGRRTGFNSLASGTAFLCDSGGRPDRPGPTPTEPIEAGFTSVHRCFRVGHQGHQAHSAFRLEWPSSLVVVLRRRGKGLDSPGTK